MSKNDAEYIVRFHPLRRMEHLLVIVCFFSLVITGLPQKFYEMSWAVGTVHILGGLESVRFWHRVFGFIFSIQFGLHILFGLHWLLVKKRHPTMAPSMKDVRDAILNFRYCLRLTEDKPRYGRFDFKQKFEYWGMIIGGGLMVATGWVLWEPVLFSKLLPAEFIPVSRVAHSNEAFLAFSVILFWHIYSVTLNPEVFPLDKTIFTGKISRKRMKEEHPLELEDIDKSS